MGTQVKSVNPTKKIRAKLLKNIGTYKFSVKDKDKRNTNYQIIKVEGDIVIEKLFYTVLI